MEDAELSDVEEEEEATAAPGKENQNPKPRKGPMASRSFMLKNCCFQTKTNSDASSDGSMPLNMIKALHLDDDKAPISTGGGTRFSDESYRPPFVESAAGRSSKIEVQGFEEGKDANCEVDHSEMKDSGTSRPCCDEQACSPTILVPIQPATTTTSSTKKKVHWMKDDRQPMTADSTHPYHSDSGFSSGYRSDLSMKSTGSRGRRRNPADISKGSPPEREGAMMVENIGDGVKNAREHNGGFVQRSGSNEHSFGRDSSSQEAFEYPVCEAAHEEDENVPSSAAIRPQTLPGLQGSMPPNPAESYDAMTAKPSSDSQTVPRYWNYGSQSPMQEFPNFSRPYQSPNKAGLSDTHNLYGNPVSSPGYGTRPDYHAQPYAFHSSTHFSDSTTRRDFSGYEAPDFEVYSSPEDDHGASGHFTSEGGGDDYSFSPSTGPSAFDFSHFGGTAPSSEATGDRFVRTKKKFARAGAAKENTRTPNRHSWRLYDDGDVDDGETGVGDGCEWRDGRTTVHRAGRTPNSGNLVTILSIREIKSDEELSVAGDRGGYLRQPGLWLVMIELLMRV